MRAPSLLSLGLELAVSRQQVVVGVLSWSTGEIFGNLLDRGHVAGIHSQNAA